MRGANHQAGHSAPRPTTHSGAEIQSDALVKVIAHIKTEQATIIWIAGALFETSNVNWMICSRAVDDGAQRSKSLMRGSNMRVGKAVLAVTLETELSTTKLGEPLSAITKPNLPTATLAYLDLSSSTICGTRETNPAATSSATND